MEEVIPGRLLTALRRDDFLAWLRDLQVDPEDKRQLLITWCDKVGVKVTGDMIKRGGAS